MTPSKTVRAQLWLGLDDDESKIWKTLEATQQQQVTECLVKLWLEYVIANQSAISSSSAASDNG